MYENYARLRDKRGYTDYRVSKETGITKSTFSEWKRGRSNPKVEKLRKIAKCLNTTIEALLEEEEEGESE